MQAVAADTTRPVEVQRADGVGRRTDYVGSPGIINTDAQAFLVELPYAGATVRPHFHDVDQFQVVVAGDGRIGKKALSPGVFQYADAYTPYGPIVANDVGISFFTLRNIASGGHFKMPGSRHLMPCRAGRNVTGAFDLAQPRPAARAWRDVPLMSAHSDGLFALGLYLGANARRDAASSAGGGQYYLVCDGALVHDEQLLGRHSLLRVNAGETPPALTAGPDGCSVLFLQFAAPSARPGSDPSALAARDPAGYVVRKDH